MEMRNKLLQESKRPRIQGIIISNERAYIYSNEAEGTLQQHSETTINLKHFYVTKIPCPALYIKCQFSTHGASTSSF